VSRAARQHDSGADDTAIGAFAVAYFGTDDCAISAALSSCSTRQQVSPRIPNIPHPSRTRLKITAHVFAPARLDYGVAGRSSAAKRCANHHHPSMAPRRARPFPRASVARKI
jgi:hypothetical protein